MMTVTSLAKSLYIAASNASSCAFPCAFEEATESTKRYWLTVAREAFRSLNLAPRGEPEGRVRQFSTGMGGALLTNLPLHEKHEPMSDDEVQAYAGDCDSQFCYMVGESMSRQTARAVAEAIDPTADFWIPEPAPSEEGWPERLEVFWSSPKDGPCLSPNAHEPWWIDASQAFLPEKERARFLELVARYNVVERQIRYYGRAHVALHEWLAEEREKLR